MLIIACMEIECNFDWTKLNKSSEASKEVHVEYLIGESLFPSTRCAQSIVLSWLLHCKPINKKDCREGRHIFFVLLI